jgi:hypothetical protein
MSSISPNEESSAMYAQSEFSAPVPPEHHLENQYDNEDPNRAMSNYARY